MDSRRARVEVGKPTRRLLKSSSGGDDDGDLNQGAGVERVRSHFEYFEDDFCGSRGTKVYVKTCQM